MAFSDRISVVRRLISNIYWPTAFIFVSIPIMERYKYRNLGINEKNVYESLFDASSLIGNAEKFVLHIL